MIDKWDLRYLELAKEVARYSKDPSTKAGAVLVDPHGGQVGSGFNGFARGVEDLPERYDDRDLKLMMIVHSEVNAIVFSKRDLWGCTIYTWPFPPCSNCAAIIIQAGIFRCVSPPVPEDKKVRWEKSMALAVKQFEEGNVRMDILDMDAHYLAEGQKLGLCQHIGGFPSGW